MSRSQHTFPKPPACWSLGSWSCPSSWSSAAYRLASCTSPWIAPHHRACLDKELHGAGHSAYHLNLSRFRSIQGALPPTGHGGVSGSTVEAAKNCCIWTSLSSHRDLAEFRPRHSYWAPKLGVGCPLNGTLSRSSPSSFNFTAGIRAKSS